MVSTSRTRCSRSRSKISSSCCFLDCARGSVLGRLFRAGRDVSGELLREGWPRHILWRSMWRIRIGGKLAWTPKIMSSRENSPRRTEERRGKGCPDRLYRADDVIGVSCLSQHSLSLSMALNSLAKVLSSSSVMLRQPMQYSPRLSLCFKDWDLETLTRAPCFCFSFFGFLIGVWMVQVDPASDDLNLCRGIKLARAPSIKTNQEKSLIR